MKNIEKAFIAVFAFVLIGTSVFISCDEKVDPVQMKLEELVVQNQVPGINFSIINSEGIQSNFLRFLHCHHLSCLNSSIFACSWAAS